MTRYRVFGLVALVAGLLLAYFVWSTQVNPGSKYQFKLGLDLAGGVAGGCWVPVAAIFLPA